MIGGFLSVIKLTNNFDYANFMMNIFKKYSMLTKQPRGAPGVVDKTK